MFRQPLMFALLLVLGVSSQSLAISTADISLSHYYLQPNTPNQTIPIYVTGGAQVSGVNFNLQIGDGGPEAGGTPGPVFTNLDLTDNTIFQFDYSDPVDTGSIPQLLTWYVLTQNSGDHVAAEGLLATVTIDTTGFFDGTWAFHIADTLNGATNFTDGGAIPGTLRDGSMTVVPEPSSIGLLLAGSCGLVIMARRRKK